MKKYLILTQFIKNLKNIDKADLPIHFDLIY